MTIDLKWFLPLGLPFIILIMLRLLVAMAGVPWQPIAAAVSLGLSAIIGVIVGVATAFNLEDKGVRWNVKLGERK